MKLCKNCRYWDGGYRCNRLTGIIDPIDGARKLLNETCKSERSIAWWLGGCGKRARHFKQKGDEQWTQKQ